MVEESWVLPLIQEHSRGRIMAITKEVVEDKIEIVSDYKHIQVRTVTIIKEDGKEISRTNHRHIISPDTDSSNESADVKAMVAHFHTDTVKAAWEEHKKSSVPEESGYRKNGS